MLLYDRLYKRLSFPSLIKKVLDCPGLLRLREVRMANIPFFAFPAFASTTRYEHSLGVCHLASLFSKQAELSEKDKIETMLAAIYHDVATPPFAHAMEEVLMNLYGFDHEEKLRQLIIGQTEDIGKYRAQLFLGHSLKLHSVCQTKEARKLNIDIFRIADLAAGSSLDPLGSLISSDDIDLDNIDNVFRAASAMGIYSSPFDIPEKLSKNYIFSGEKIYLDEGGLSLVQEWQRVRKQLYELIYASIQDFSQQAMLKHAIKYLTSSSSKINIQESDWCLTDDELTHQRLLCDPNTAEIIQRMRLGNMYSCLSILSVEGKKCIEEITKCQEQIEQIAADCFLDYFIRANKRNKVGAKMKMPEIVTNFYIDKRHRQIKRSFLFMGQVRQLKDDPKPKTKVLLGVFTPYHRKWDVTASNSFIDRLKNSFQDLSFKKLHITRDQLTNNDGVF